jgi:hypothetical protein
MLIIVDGSVINGVLISSRRRDGMDDAYIVALQVRQHRLDPDAVKWL